MTDIFQSRIHWRSLVILVLFLKSFACSGAGDSPLERAKAISSSVQASASAARDTYFEASRDAEDVLADLKFDQLIDRILESDEEREIARGVQQLKQVFQDLDEWLHPSSDGKAWFTGHEEVLLVEQQESWLDGNSTDFATGLLNSGACATLLAGLAASGIAQQYGIPHDDALAVHALQLAQETGDHSADVAMADRLIEGRGMPQDCPAGMRLALRHAEDIIHREEQSGQAGTPPMEPPLLRLRWRDAGYAQTSAQYEEAAAGDMPGTDAGAAVQELQAMVEEGAPYGFLALGHHLVHGQHVQANLDDARVMFQAAADLGEPGGLVGLGYLEMRGDPPDVAVARRVYEAAAAMGNAEAHFNLGAIYGGTFAGVPPDTVNLTLSEEHFMKAYHAGHYKSPLMLAHIHMSGLGVEANCSKAAGFVRVVLQERSGWSEDVADAVAALDEGKPWKALVMQASVAEEGSPIGMLNVAFMLQHGLGYGAPDRHALAYDLLLRAARLERYYGDGLVDAAAIMYDGDRLGIPGGKNLSRALELYEQAAGRNDTEGTTGLAWMHEHGEGMRSGHANTTLALQLYWQAVEGAPEASYAVAPFLLFFWLRLRLLAANIPGLKPQHSIVADMLNVMTLTMSLLFVIWLRRSRVWLGLGRRR
ncbi:g13388 [Coccomyxa viridis]|uniref:G13388 protein n=1 Tax=Coccomyxa viridis TaxID=1274662 RepID=A0ABP1GHB6_9CHLO